ncbi:hypothetical protein HDU87_001988 [Geranomyces variabilis]|uniref:G-protein coupled receptors family 3 profile domain-containing protein n=1 Tax=Geranomyces variabilis TaxID=109894 RepID=A0AAD5TLU8_9FUNG|nr:hypothetical protein HDU87_001988 [Geranomyces variabilis]
MEGLECPKDHITGIPAGDEQPFTCRLLLAFRALFDDYKRLETKQMVFEAVWYCARLIPSDDTQISNSQPPCDPDGDNHAGKASQGLCDPDSDNRLGLAHTTATASQGSCDPDGDNCSCGGVGKAKASQGPCDPDGDNRSRGGVGKASLASPARKQRKEDAKNYYRSSVPEVVSSRLAEMISESNAVAQLLTLVLVKSANDCMPRVTVAYQKLLIGYQTLCSRLVNTNGKINIGGAGILAMEDQRLLRNQMCYPAPKAPKNVKAVADKARDTRDAATRVMIEEYSVAAEFDAETHLPTGGTYFLFRRLKGAGYLLQSTLAEPELLCIITTRPASQVLEVPGPSMASNMAKTNVYPGLSQSPHYISVSTLHSVNKTGHDDGMDDNYVTVSNEQIYFMPNSVAPNGFQSANWTTLRLGEWHHYALTYDSATGYLNLYGDGQLWFSETGQAANTYIGATMSSTVALILGQDQDSFYGSMQSYKAFIGVMDEVRIWSAARTQQQIQQNMNFSLPGSTAGLYSKWGMDQVNVATIDNEVNASNNLILGGINPFPGETPCPDNLVGIADLVACNRQPAVVPSDAPITGSGVVTTYIPIGQLTSVELPGSSDVPAAVITTTVSSLGTCNGGGWTMFLDSAGTTPATVGSTATNHKVWLRAAVGTTASCTFTYDAADGSTTASATVTANVAAALAARNIEVDIVEGDLNVLIPLTARPFNQGPPRLATITSTPQNGNIYAVTMIWTAEPEVLGALSLGDTINPETTIIQYVALPNQIGTPFDTFSFSIEGDNGIASSVDGVVTINVAGQQGVPAVAAINTYYLTFLPNQHVDIPSFPILPMLQFTLEMWIWPNPTTPSSSAQVWATADGSYALTHDGINNKLNFAVAGATILTAQGILPQSWSHVAVAKALNGTLALYVNNAMVGSNLPPAAAPLVGQGIIIGKGFEGALDEIAVFNSSNVMGPSRKLNVALGPGAASLTAVWHLNEGTLGTASCSSGTPGATCSYVANLGGGHIIDYPLWTLAPTTFGMPGFTGFPLTNGYYITENASPIVVQLNAITQDSDSRLVALTINSLPTLGQLYQYNATNPPSFLGAPITAEFQPWRSSVTRNEQWVSRVATNDSSLMFSTQYDTSSYSILGVLGAPQQYAPARADLGYGDSPSAWCPRSTSGDCVSVASLNPFGWACRDTNGNPEMEYVDVGYEVPRHIVGVISYENYNPGSTEIISARDPKTQDWIPIWQGTAMTNLYQFGAYVAQKYLLFSPTVCGTPFKTDAIRIQRANWKVGGWKEIDAVKNIGIDELDAGYVTDPQYRVVYVPNPSENGPDSFSYGATDCIGDNTQLSQPNLIDIHIASLVHPAGAPANLTAVYSISREEGGTGDIKDFPVVLEAYARDERVPQFQIVQMPSTGYLMTPSQSAVVGNSLWAPTSNLSTQMYLLNLTFHATGCGSDSLAYRVIDSLTTSDPINVQLNLQCLPYYTYSSPLGIVVVLLTVLGLLGVCAAGLLLKVRGSHKAIKAASPVFLTMILAGLALTFISNLFYAGPVTKATCMTASTLLSIGFSLAMGSLCIKNWRIYRIFTRTHKTVLKDRQMLQLALPFPLLNAAILLVWGAVSPPKPLMESPGTASQYLVCQSSNDIGSAILIAYNAAILLATVSFAFLNRNIALDYNESKQLAIASYNVIVLSLLGLPVTFMSGTTPGLVFLVRAICIWGASFFVLAIIFAPKAWVTLRKEPERDQFIAVSGSVTGASATAKLKSSSAVTSQGGGGKAQTTSGVRPPEAGSSQFKTTPLIHQRLMVRFKSMLMFSPWREMHVTCLPLIKTLVFANPDGSAQVSDMRKQPFTWELLPADGDKDDHQVLRLHLGGKAGIAEVRLNSAEAIGWGLALSTFQDDGVTLTGARKSSKSVAKHTAMISRNVLGPQQESDSDQEV